MGNGYIWIGIVTPLVTVIVSGYLVWRAIQDHRRMESEGGPGGGSSPNRHDPLARGAGGPGRRGGGGWRASDPDAWKPAGWQPDPDADGWSPDDIEEWSPDRDDEGQGPLV